MAAIVGQRGHRIGQRVGVRRILVAPCARGEVADGVDPAEGQGRHGKGDGACRRRVVCRRFDAENNLRQGVREGQRDGIGVIRAVRDRGRCVAEICRHLRSLLDGIIRRGDAAGGVDVNPGRRSRTGAESVEAERSGERPILLLGSRPKFGAVLGQGIGGGEIFEIGIRPVVVGTDHKGLPFGIGRPGDDGLGRLGCDGRERNGVVGLVDLRFRAGRCQQQTYYI